MKEKLIAVVGPTAVGKTKAGVEIARHFNSEVISGDSMQVYKGLDIGTAKVTPEEMGEVPHHMINIKKPGESFTAAEFQEKARRLVTDINQKGSIPVVVGGTGLYIRALTRNFSFNEAEKDEGFRKSLEEKAEKFGKEAVHQKLWETDPKSAKEIPPQNLRRVIRALEIYHLTGKTMDRFYEQEEDETPYNLQLIGLSMEREKLYQRINERVDQMMKEGLLEEVQWLYDRGLQGSQSARGIGYKELLMHLEGKASLSEAVELLKRNSRRYAKRQLTWFRNKENVEWFDMSQDNHNEKIKEMISFLEGKYEKGVE
ncbi:tRNA (adenosine(37)-N6)-dimethylallyltransferase MiaA [Thalassorhabdus alkalitolerans]|uniref:tRNA dimethylallyltransferase n=1 Tax=Thalassorhabdus alkalitolerans TaxID=2282697 RepID=A0ABW0YK68_9BACI